MKKLYRNSAILTLALTLLAFNFIAERTDAQASSGSDKPNPKAKNTPKKTADAKTKPTPKPANAPKSGTKTGEQIIITATNVIVRKEASTKSARLTAVKLGKILPVIERSSAFYQVEYEDGKNGWISTTFTRDYNADKRDSLYREIGDKQLKTQKIDFTTASETTEFLRTAAAMVKTDEARADLSFKRLRFIAAALKAIPSGKGEQPPYKNFIRANEKDIVYSDPSAEWYVRAESFWDLREKFAALPLAEEIAWTAANTQIPGECEGYINCYLYNIRAADGEYLSL